MLSKLPLNCTRAGQSRHINHSSALLQQTRKGSFVGRTWYVSVLLFLKNQFISRLSDHGPRPVVATTTTTTSNLPLARVGMWHWQFSPRGKTRGRKCLPSVGAWRPSRNAVGILLYRHVTYCKCDHHEIRVSDSPGTRLGRRTLGARSPSSITVPEKALLLGWFE